MKLGGARIVITGAGSGIGRATALHCARRRASVIAVDIDGGTASATADACGSLGASRRLTRATCRMQRA